MKTTRELKTLSRALFFLGVFFVVVFFADWFSGPFFLNRDYRVLKYLLCVTVPALCTVFNYHCEKTLRFMGNAMVVIMSFFVIGFLAFNLLGINAFLFREMSSLFHITYALIAVFTVFITATVIAHLEKNKKTEYAFFYNAFFIGYIPVMIMLYVLVYFNYRASDMEYAVNFIPFNGEIKAVLSDFESLTVMRTLGNIAFYSTISLTAARFAKKHQALWAFLVPFIICVLSETMQGLFALGDADIDDVILNGTGALIGALIYKFLIEKIRRKSICSE